MNRDAHERGRGPFLRILASLTATALLAHAVEQAPAGHSSVPRRAARSCHRPATRTRLVGAAHSAALHRTHPAPAPGPGRFKNSGAHETPDRRSRDPRGAVPARPRALHQDVAAYLLAGADVVMTTSALLRHGPEHAETLLEGLTGWMRRKGFTRVDQVRGMLAESVAEHGVDRRGEENGRSGYLTALQKASAKYILSSS